MTTHELKYYFNTTCPEREGEEDKKKKTERKDARQRERKARHGKTKQGEELF